MRIKKTIAGVTAAAAALAGGVALASPAQAWWFTPSKSITETAVALSGGSKAGVPDRIRADFDILITALSNTTLEQGNPADGTTLAAVLDGDTDFTVVAPTDGAFIRSANELRRALDITDTVPRVKNEAQAIDFYVNVVGLDTVRAVLLYHVVPGDQRYSQLRKGGDIDTALKAIDGVEEATFDAKRRVIVDQLDREARVFLKNVPADNGKLNVIGKVILPGL